MKIMLQGAGKTSTVITMSTTGIAVDIGNSGSRLTGFGFVAGQLRANGNNFRIDHPSLSFASFTDGILAGSRDVVPAAPATGVIDHNDFTRGRVLTSGTHCMLTDNCGAAQDTLWAMPVNLRVGNAIYVEDNTFTSDVFGNAIDQNYGGRYVFRFNTINDNGSATNS